MTKCPPPTSQVALGTQDRQRLALDSVGVSCTEPGAPRAWTGLAREQLEGQPPALLLLESQGEPHPHELVDQLGVIGVA